MSIIRENLLPTQGSLPSSWFLRMVSDTGASKRIASSLVKWTIADITDLATSLDAKQDLSTLKSMAAYLDSTGQSVGSGFFMGTIADITDLDAAFCGLYTAPVPFSITNIGDVYGALAISRNAIGEDFATEDNTSSAQLIFTSNGLYMRSYSTSWGLYRYVGGGVQPQPVTRAQLIDLMDEGELVQGTKYIITDHPNDMGIIVEAASSSLLSQYALRLACQPKYYEAGDYFSGSDGTVKETWEGVYEIGFTPTAGHIYVFAGMVYKNLTGDDSTAGEYILNSTDWELQTVEWGSYYSPNICEVIYKIGLTSSPADEPCGVIQSQTDVNNNTFGAALMGYPTLAQRTRIDYNDWGHPNIRKCELVHCWSNKESCTLIAVRGSAHIYRNKNTSLASVRITDDSVLIYDNTYLTLYDCDVIGNIYSNISTSITYSEINAVVASNGSLTITDCEANSNITSNVSCTVTSSNIFGTFSGNYTCYVTNSTLNANFTNNTGTFDFIENKGLINNNTLTASRVNNVSEISGNTGVFSDVQTNDVDCPIKNNTSIILSECRLIAGGVGPHLGIQNCEDIEISSAEIWGGITSCKYCDFNNFKIESVTAYITLCDYLNIDNSYLRGISWISKVSGTGYNELASSISGCTIDGELEELGAGYGSGTKFTLTDCVIGKSGDIKRSDGYVRETRLDGNITDVAVLAVDNSVIETQSDFDDYVNLKITDSYIGSSVDGNQSDPSTISGTIVRSHIYSNTVFPAAFSITDSKIKGTFRGTANYSEISGTFSGTAIRSEIFYSTTVSATITDSIIKNSSLDTGANILRSIIIKAVCGGDITDSEIYSDCYGTITNSTINRGAEIKTVGNGNYIFINTTIGSQAYIDKGNFGDITITDSYINGYIYQDDGIGASDDSITRVYMEYGSEISDSPSIKLEDCKLLYGAKLSGTEFYTHKLYKTIIDYDATRPVLADLSTDTTLGGISACSYLSEVLEVATGDYNVGISGGTPSLTSVKSNGITIANSTGLHFTVKKAGWYIVDYTATAFTDTKCTLEMKAFISGTPDVEIPQSYKATEYLSTGDVQNSSIRFMVYLNSNASVYIKYKHDDAVNPIEYTITGITLTIRKEL